MVLPETCICLVHHTLSISKSVKLFTLKLSLLDSLFLRPLLEVKFVTVACKCREAWALLLQWT